MHMEWIPLKTADGRLVGHAKVKDGFVGLSLKTEERGSAMVLTSAGSVHGAMDARIAVLDPVLAAAVHDGGRLVCYGVARGAGLSADDIRRRLPAGAPPPARPVQKKEPAAPVAASAARPEPVPVSAAVPIPAPAAVSAAPAVLIPTAPATVPGAPDPAPEKPARTPPPPVQKEAEAFHPQTEKGAYPAFEDVVEAREPVSPAPTRRDTAREAEAFFALLNRSDRVYRAANETVAPAQVPAERASRAAYGGRDWHEEVDAFLERTGERVRTGVPNPFPHIFPNAAFTRIQKNGVTERLEGDWRRGPERFLIYAVPGSYNPVPPSHLPGFTRYIRSRAGGFWVKVMEQ